MQSPVISHTALRSPGGDSIDRGNVFTPACRASDAPDAILVKPVCVPTGSPASCACEPAGIRHGVAMLHARNATNSH